MTAADPMAILRRRTSDKWTAHPSDVLPMFIAEMDFPLAPAIRAALHDAVDAGDTGYLGRHGSDACAAFAGYAGDTWGWRPEVDRMGITTDVSVVIVETLRRVARPGDGVVIMPPIYPPFYELIDEAGARVVEVPLRDDGDTYALDVAGIDRALADGARGVLLCHPHNPLGHLHPRPELEELARIVDRHDGFVVSDEIHAPLTHHGHEFVPYLTVSEAARAHGMAAESGSKAFNLAGLKTAFFVAAGDRMARVIDSLPMEVTYRTGLFGALATRAGFTDGRDWLASTVATIEANVAHLDEQLRAHLPGVGFRPPRASYLAWLDMSALGWGPDPAVRALTDARVALSNGPTFGAPGADHARMNLACSPDTITEAVSRLARVAHGQP